MSKRQHLATTRIDTRGLDAAAGRGAAQMVDEAAADFVLQARRRAAEFGLHPALAGQMLAAATGRFVAEGAANIPHLTQLIAAATETIDGVARGHYNDRIDGQMLIRGIPGLPLKEA